MLLYSGTIILFFVNSRFRIPLWPGMAILAGGGAIQFGHELKNKRLSWVPALLSTILLLASLINWFSIPPDPIENDLSARAQAYLDKSQTNEALDDILQCLEIAPYNPRYHFLKGNILLAMEEYNAAAQSYLQAINRNPSDPMFHNNLGVSLENMGEYAGAEKAYTNALQLRPNHKAARTNLDALRKIRP